MKPQGGAWGNGGIDRREGVRGCLGDDVSVLLLTGGSHHDPADQHSVGSVVRGSPAPPEASHQEDLDGCVVLRSQGLVWRSVRGE